PRASASRRSGGNCSPAAMPSSRSRSWSRIEWNFVTAPLRHRTHTKSRPLVYFVLLPEGGGCSAGAFLSPARSGVGAGSALVQELARVPASLKGWREFRPRSRAGAKIESSTVAYLRSALIDAFWTLVGCPQQAGADRRPRDRRPTRGVHG